MADRTHIHDRFERQGPRFHEVLLVKVGVTTTACIGVVLLASTFFIPAGIKVLGSGREQSESTKQLAEQLELLRTTWEPRQRQRILDQAPIHARQFAGPLHRILRVRDDRLLEPAVEYAGALGVADLRPTLAQMSLSPEAVPPTVRAKAMQAAERLGPWSRNELAEFLTAGAAPVKVSALEICAGRWDAPWAQVLELLDGGDDAAANKAVTAAAIKAIPEIPPPELLQALWAMVANGEPGRVLQGLVALRRTRLDADTCSKLSGRLARLDSDAQLVCLDLLGRSGRRLYDPSPVWQLVASQETRSLVRAQALYCLEQTQSYQAQEIRKQIFHMEPLAKYFAARCLIAAGQKDGADILLELMDTEEEELSVASRRLLAWMTGRSPGTSRKEFRDALGATHRSTAHLPAPGFDFGGPSAAPASTR